MERDVEGTARGLTGTGAKASDDSVTRDQLLARYDDAKLALVNVLPFVAFEEAHIPGSISLPVDDVVTRAPSLLPDRTHEIIVYCGGFT